MGCPIRISTDQSLFAAPHGFSQRTTSFIACACQGIHQMPLRHLIVLIAHDHQVDPKGANRERRSRALHSREPCKSRQRVQRHPRSCSMAPASTPSLGRTAAGKKTSFQRRTPRAAVRHTHPCKGAVRSSRAMNPPGGDPRTEPHPPLGSHDPSGSVFSSLVQEQADIRSDDQSCNLASFFLDNPSNHPHHSTAQNGSGGACRDRTDDPLLAKQVLSQLS